MWTCYKQPSKPKTAEKLQTVCTTPTGEELPLQECKQVHITFNQHACIPVTISLKYLPVQM
jgi:hypothetical protein